MTNEPSNNNNPPNNCTGVSDASKNNQLTITAINGKNISAKEHALADVLLRP